MAIPDMLSIIAAMSKDRVIGKNGKIPWHLPADLARFKTLTMGHPVIMGRRTYESVGHALPGRTNIVLSRSPEFNPPDAATVSSLKEALDLTRDAGEVFVIGGESVYRQALPLADRIYLTAVDTETDGDVFFPRLDESQWEVVSEEEHKKDEKNRFSCRYLIYKRKNSIKL